MAKAIFIQDGAVIDYKNTGSSKIENGEVVALTDCIGVAVCEIAAGETGSVAIEGVFEFPAETTAAFTAGKKVYWDATNSVVSATATSNTLLGIAVEAKQQAGATCCCKLR